MKNKIEDFTYDFTYFVKQRLAFCNDSNLDKLIKYYLFTHQFSEYIDLTEQDVLDICQIPLEEDEFVYKNNNQFLFYLNNDDNIKNEDIISVLKFLFNTLSYRIENIRIDIKENKKIFFINVKHFYDNIKYEGIKHEIDFN